MSIVWQALLRYHGAQASRGTAEGNKRTVARADGKLQSAREQEGVRIAREIHDELGSALTSLRWDLEAIEKTLSGGRPVTDASIAGQDRDDGWSD